MEEAVSGEAVHHGSDDGDRPLAQDTALPSEEDTAMRTTASTTLLTAAALTLAACNADTATSPVDGPAFAKAADVAMCHRNEDTAGFEFLMVPGNGKAIEKHLAHGDAYPGDPIPGGFTPFAADCSLPFYAIAYVDRDPNDGNAYHAGVDRLISALLDTDGSLGANAGDEVYVFGFPLDFAASAFGSVASPSHTVTYAGLSTDCSAIFIDDDEGSYAEWRNHYATTSSDRVWDDFLVENADGWATLAIFDIQAGPDSDWLFSDQGGASFEPDRSIDLRDASAADTDNDFIDVQILCGC